MLPPLLRLIVLGVIASCAAIAHSDEKKTADRDMKQLEGTWIVVAQSFDGDNVDPADLKKDNIRIIISSDELIIMAGVGVRSKSTWTIDATQNPKQINLVEIEPVKDSKAVGIYELEGDTLKMCIGPSTGKRPVKFETTKSSKYVVHILQREKAKK